MNVCINTRNYFNRYKRECVCVLVRVSFLFYSYIFFLFKNVSSNDECRLHWFDSCITHLYHAFRYIIYKHSSNSDRTLREIISMKDTVRRGGGEVFMLIFDCNKVRLFGVQKSKGAKVFVVLLHSDYTHQ